MLVSLPGYCSKKKKKNRNDIFYRPLACNTVFTGFIISFSSPTTDLFLCLWLGELFSREGTGMAWKANFKVHQLFKKQSFKIKALGSKCHCWTRSANTWPRFSWPAVSRPVHGSWHSSMAVFALLIVSRKSSWGSHPQVSSENAMCIHRHAEKKLEMHVGIADRFVSKANSMDEMIK